MTATIDGERIDFTVEDVIAAEGPRVPARDICHWKAAFMIVHEEGVPPSNAEIARVDAYRLRWEQFYAEATDRRGSFDTTLTGMGAGTAECPAEIEPPIPDAGVVPPDASYADATLTDGAEADLDSGLVDDAEVIDAEDHVKLLRTGDCSCRTTAEHSSVDVLLLLMVVAARVLSARTARVACGKLVRRSISDLSC